jgi:hypothetical protein
VCTPTCVCETQCPFLLPRSGSTLPILATAVLNCGSNGTQDAAAAVCKGFTAADCSAALCGTLLKLAHNRHTPPSHALTLALVRSSHSIPTVAPWGQHKNRHAHRPLPSIQPPLNSRSGCSARMLAHDTSRHAARAGGGWTWRKSIDHLVARRSHQLTGAVARNTTHRGAHWPTQQSATPHARALTSTAERNSTRIVIDRPALVKCTQPQHWWQKATPSFAPTLTSQSQDRPPTNSPTHPLTQPTNHRHSHTDTHASTAAHRAGSLYRCTFEKRRTGQSNAPKRIR